MFFSWLYIFEYVRISEYLDTRRLSRCTPCPAADSGRCAGLFPTIARINHSCRPNVVWGQRGKNPMAKEVRVTRR